jgi:hypothetical protein
MKRVSMVAEADVRAKTGNETSASLDQALQNKHNATKISNTDIASKYRLRQQIDKTTAHMLSIEQYIQRYDRVCSNTQ